MMQFLTTLMEQYGYAVLFLSLMLELIAIPFPGEFMMGYAGVLVFQGKLNWIASIAVAGAGCCTGMTVSYWIGYKLGTPFFHKHGHRIHLGPDKFEKTSKWFKNYGNKLLLIAYFIPGVRHFTGYFSGVTQIPFRTYALFAYSGAFIWTGTFISLGKLLGPQWEQFHASIKKYFLVGSVVAITILVILYFIKKNKLKIDAVIMARLGSGAERFHSLRRLRLLIVITAILFLVFVVFIGSVTENYVNNEFNQFDTIVLTLVPLIFNDRSAVWMKLFGLFASRGILIALITFTFLWIVVKAKERLIEIVFFFIAVIGGEIFEEGIRRIFHHLEPIHQRILYSFPSEQTLTAFVLYGFSAYLLVRHSQKSWLQTVTSIVVVIILILIGLSRIYFKQQNPSDVVAGYAFGGVWLSLNILVLELFRFSHRLSKLRD